MPLVVKLDGMDMQGVEHHFTVKSKADYLKIGFAAARWARQAVRGATVGEGEYSTSLILRASFFSGEPRKAEPEPEPEILDDVDDVPAAPRKRKRRKK